jgi:hypothetical protein
MNRTHVVGSGTGRLAVPSKISATAHGAELLTWEGPEKDGYGDPQWHWMLSIPAVDPALDRKEAARVRAALLSAKLLTAAGSPQKAKRFAQSI